MSERKIHAVYRDGPSYAPNRYLKVEVLNQAISHQMFHVKDEQGREFLAHRHSLELTWIAPEIQKANPS